MVDIVGRTLSPGDEVLYLSFEYGIYKEDAIVTKIGPVRATIQVVKAGKPYRVTSVNPINLVKKPNADSLNLVD